MAHATRYTFHWGELSRELFLREYWQKNPLLIKNAYPGFHSPLDGDELAGLSLESWPASRLVQEKQRNNSHSQWSTQHGPFTEKSFARLPSSHWTLLVQQVDQCLTEVEALKNSIDFIPQWRCEDVMVSYAADQGSVGPHFDYYDVFLVQGHGQRLWQLGQHCTSSTPLLDNCDMRILKQFEAQQEYLVEAGDVLYIPPGVAHWGIAQGECLTYSIGFRAPSHAEILLDFSAEIAAELSEDLRYQDPENAVLGKNQAEIHDQTISSLSEIIQRYMGDKNRLAKWFGKYMTQQISDEESTPSCAPGIIMGATYRLEQHCRSAYMLNEHQAKAMLFVNGQTYTLASTYAKELSLGRCIVVNDQLDEDDIDVLKQLETNHLLSPCI